MITNRIRTDCIFQCSVKENTVIFEQCWLLLTSIRLRFLRQRPGQSTFSHHNSFTCFKWFAGTSKVCGIMYALFLFCYINSILFYIHIIIIQSFCFTNTPVFNFYVNPDFVSAFKRIIWWYMPLPWPGFKGATPKRVSQFIIICYVSDMHLKSPWKVTKFAEWVINPNRHF